MTAPVVEVSGLTVQDGAGQRVLDGISLQLPEGSSIGVVGESGSGKTTLALAMLGAVRPGLHATGGEVRVAGEPILPAASRAVRDLRREVIAYLGQPGSGWRSWSSRTTLPSSPGSPTPYSSCRTAAASSVAASSSC